MTASLYTHFSERELALLQKRAERAAQSVAEDQKEEFITTLNVSVGHENYALPINSVANAYEGVPITPVPHAPSYVLGLANLRGHMMLVLDLGRLLDVKQDSGTDKTLIVVADDELSAALAVDYIAGVKEVALSSLASLPNNLSLSQFEHLQGVLPNGAVLVDIDAMLTQLLANMA
jgi:purine-binding chemotaxis protein CheW